MRLRSVLRFIVKIALIVLVIAVLCFVFCVTWKEGESSGTPWSTMIMSLAPILGLGAIVYAYRDYTQRMKPKVEGFFTCSGLFCDDKNCGAQTDLLRIKNIGESKIENLFIYRVGSKVGERISELYPNNESHEIQIRKPIFINSSDTYEVKVKKRVVLTLVPPKSCNGKGYSESNYTPNDNISRMNEPKKPKVTDYNSKNNVNKDLKQIVELFKWAQTVNWVNNSITFRMIKGGDYTCIQLADFNDNETLFRDTISKKVYSKVDYSILKRFIDVGCKRISPITRQRLTIDCVTIVDKKYWADGEYRYINVRELKDIHKHMKKSLKEFDPFDHDLPTIDEFASKHGLTYEEKVLEVKSISIENGYIIETLGDLKGRAYRDKSDNRSFSIEILSTTNLQYRYKLHPNVLVEKDGCIFSVESVYALLSEDRHRDIAAYDKNSGIFYMFNHETITQLQVKEEDKRVIDGYFFQTEEYKKKI